MTAVFCSACGGEMGAPTDRTTPVETSMKVFVSSGALSLPVGESIRLNVSVVDQAGAPVAGVDLIEWSVSDVSVVTVKDGLMTTLKSGTTTVTATAWVTSRGVKAEGSATVEVTGPGGTGSTAQERCGDGVCSASEACQCASDCGMCGTGPSSLFADTQPSDIAATTDGKAVVVGLKFRTVKPGRIRAIRFFKGAGTTGNNRGSLWAGAGQQLGQVTFRNETASGWQQATLSNPTTVMPGTTYVVALHTSNGYVVRSGGFFAKALTQGPLRALADGEDGPNGLFHPSPMPQFPTQSASGANHYVDVVFEPMP